MEHPAINLISNSGLVLRHFGYWPSLHDAVTERVSFEVKPPAFRASAIFLIAACETTDEVDEDGSYNQVKHCNIELQFTGIQEMNFALDHQPVVFGMRFEGNEQNIKCIYSSSAGTGIIVAEDTLVLSLTPTKR
ncbi:hypothetical protein LJ737_09125 [Hymenobacter sp. 15J16-1T3B]|uniref:hypothetical protein n=1 Tax=Hymenobacter sp. 15J16-1T3B TaxID=2886941 RepID=UPI001D0FBBCB|nr:hypothetical protein [Hymenobacter sp. 15J16-1T3B]MCC3157401.1 hypothetical protein [Hymenobacter sp. 15J16-1T3B]